MKFTELRMVCLNLDRRPDRKLQAWRQFRREGLGVKRIAAMDAVGIQDARGWRNVGARACALSQRVAWRWARRERLTDDGTFLGVAGALASRLN